MAKRTQTKQRKKKLKKKKLKQQHKEREEEGEMEDEIKRRDKEDYHHHHLLMNRKKGPMGCKWIVGMTANGEKVLCGKQFAEIERMVEHLDSEHLGTSAIARPTGDCSEVFGQNRVWQFVLIRIIVQNTPPVVHICLWENCVRAGKEFKAKYKLKVSEVLFLTYN